jgi:hypothetical protein
VHGDKAIGQSDKQVLSLWHTLYKGMLLTQTFMRNLNKHIAREVNKEDKFTGRFYLVPPMALIL